MSEKAPQNKEQTSQSFEQMVVAAEHTPSLPEHAKKQEQQRQLEKSNTQELEKVRHDILETTKGEKQVDLLEQLEESEKASQAPTSTHINAELKQVTLRRELTHIRRRLSAPDRTLSKVIHQPVVRAVSEVSGKTISRPSGMLGGGILALVGSTGYLLLAKNQGYNRYNYAVFLGLFFGGYLIGLALELAVWSVTRSRRHATN